MSALYDWKTKLEMASLVTIQTQVHYTLDLNAVWKPWDGILFFLEDPHSTECLEFEECLLRFSNKNKVSVYVCLSTLLCEEI